MKIIGTHYPPLAKFCAPEYNVLKGCNTIKLGTLFDFRNEENEKLRDEGEGTFSYSIKFPKITKVSNDWLGAFEIEGGGNIHIGELHIDGNDISIKEITLSGSTHNCWIYCISKSTTNAGNISDTHQDRWLIPHEKLQELAAYLTTLLFNSLTTSDLPEYIREKYSLQEIHQRLGISAEIREINYNSRSREIVKEEDIPLNEISEIKDGVAFIKPKLFEEEQEVRIAFWLQFDNKKISIENNAKILKLRPIDNILP